MEKRNSSVELLKVFAIFIIVISHVSQTVGTIPSVDLIDADLFIDNRMATTNLDHYLVAVFRQFGMIGNDIFFVASFWYLCESKKFSFHKIISIISDIWIISVLFLLIYFIMGEEISGMKVISSLLPTTYGNNWFLSVYILMYLFHPILNMTLEIIKKRLHLCFCIVMVIMYCIIGYFDKDVFFPSRITDAIVIYLIVSYLKKYLPHFCDDFRKNHSLAIIGAVGTFGIQLLTNLLGLRIEFFSDKVIKWNFNTSPFILMLAIGLFNSVKGKYFVNHMVNYVSSLTMYIYLFHENIHIRNTRQAIIENFLSKLGQNHLAGNVIIFSVIIFIGAVIVSIIYKETLHKAVNFAVAKLEPKIVCTIDKIVDKLMNLES